MAKLEGKNTIVGISTMVRMTKNSCYIYKEYCKNNNGKNSSSSNNNLIVKNTAFLYFRMIFSMGITLYTSRLILTTLGIEDFGIYNVIGGMVSMFLFLNTAMSNATSRFFTFEIGKGKDSEISIIFSVSLTTHLIIIGVIFLLCESIGVWFLNSKW